MMSLSCFVGKWKDCLGIPDCAYEVATDTRSVEAFLYYDAEAQPLRGSAALLSTHIVVSGGPGRNLVFWVALSAVKGMRCTAGMVFSGRSFECRVEQKGLSGVLEEVDGNTGLARRVVSLEIFTENAAITMKMAGSDGVQFCRAVLIVWRVLKGEVKPVLTSLHHPGDVVYTLAGAPIRLSATVVSCAEFGKAARYEAGTAVEIAMMSANEICIARKPPSTAVLWHSLKNTDSENLLVMPVKSLLTLAFPSSTTLKLVSCCGGVCLFETPDSVKFSSVRRALERLLELFLVGKMTCDLCQEAGHSHGLRYFDIFSLYQQFAAMDEDAVGEVLYSTLESAMGQLLSCDPRLARIMASHRDERYDDASCDSSKISLATYLMRMHILLQGSTNDRALIAFRAFGGASRGGEDDAAEEEYITLSDFRLITRDILFGLRFEFENEEKTIDDVVNDIMQASLGSNFDRDGAVMTFPVFLDAYKVLVSRVEVKKGRNRTVPHICGTPPPLLAFGSAQWVLFTYFMMGLDVSLRATADTCSIEKNTYDLSCGTPTIAGVVSVPKISSVLAASNFFRKRNPFPSADQITFSDYASSTFDTIRKRHGVDAYTLLDSLGISALRARLLLGCPCFPRNLRSSARSGALLLSSHDQHFIVKVVTLAEFRTLRKVLPAYVAHLDRYPYTLLPRYSGVYALSRGGEKNAFVISENVFSFAKLPIALVYDLKGSTMHRTTAEEDRRHGAAGKDNDFLADKRRLRLSVEAQDAFLAQVDADSQMLEQSNMLDYSLLVGIHFGDSAFASSKEATELLEKQRRGLRELALTSNAEQRNASNRDLSSSVFRAYYGGLGSSDGLEVYYFGFVDCLTAYGLKKVGEHYGKSMLLQDMKEISCVPPPEYRARFMRFMRSIIEE